MKPKPDNRKVVRKSVSMPPTMWEKLEGISESTGVPQSRIIRYLIADCDEKTIKELRRYV